VISVLLVSAAVGTLLTIGGHPAGGDVTSDKAAHKSPLLSPSASASPSAGSSAAPSAEPTPSARPRPSTRPVVQSPAPVAHPPLTVLNNSIIKSLGADAAARFRAAGWPVANVDGIPGRYRFTTVYYGPGQIEAARALVRQFPGIRVIDSRANVPELPGTGLTVVVTKDFR